MRHRYPKCPYCGDCAFNHSNFELDIDAGVPTTMVCEGCGEDYTVVKVVEVWYKTPMERQWAAIGR